MGLKWNFFSTSPLLLGHETHHFVQDEEQIQKEVVAAFRIISGAYMKILFIIKVKIQSE